VNKRAEAIVLIDTLLILTEEQPELQDISALLCAAAAACFNEALAAELIEAITPIMFAAYNEATGRNN